MNSEMESRLAEVAAASAKLQLEALASAFTTVIGELLTVLTRKEVLAEADIQTMMGRLDLAAAVLSKGVAPDTGRRLADISLALRHALDRNGGSGH